MSDPLEQDQEDTFHRLNADEFFSDVTVLLQRKGLAESDVDAAIETFNEKSGKVGAVTIVLMPSLTPESPDVPGPRLKPRVTVQVIELPELNQGDSGTGKSAESITTRVRRVLHHFANGTGGTFVFDGQEPIAVEAPKISYGVHFTRQGGDAPLAKVARPTITIVEGSATLACATAGAAIHYTTDGSYPSAANTAAHLYAAPFAVAPGVQIRAAASKTALQQSDIATATA